MDDERAQSNSLYYFH